jgi:hypothetical protein
MCFSAISSFSASIIIGGIGISTVKKTTEIGISHFWTQVTSW